jgi:hypothetical protein
MAECPRKTIEDLTRNELAQFTGAALGYLLVHYGIWFTEAANRLGPETAVELEDAVLRRYTPPALRRLIPHLGLDSRNHAPSILVTKSKDELLALIREVAKTWVTEDGLWFQAVEAKFGMARAKEVNDACWSHFAKIEAFKIRRLLKLPCDGGLDALGAALGFRLYATINDHATHRDSDGSLVFTMTECRVQAARRRKRMDDYPCKSAGIVEYTEFVREIDPRIVSECVYCPPDDVGEGRFCAWRFRTG